MQLGQMLNRGCAQQHKLSQQLVPANLQRPSPAVYGTVSQGKQQSLAALPSAAPPAARQSLVIPRAAATEAVTTTRTQPFNIDEAIKKLLADLENQMSTGTPSPELYDETVIFRDPMARVNGLKDYSDFLKLNLAIKPFFELHSMIPCGPYTALMRWTMYFPVVPDQLPRPWTPRAYFTGTTTYGFSPATQKINAHVDTWDCTDQQDWISRDAVNTVMAQMAADAARPGPTEGYKLIRLRADYEIRDYAPSAVSEAFKEGETEISPSVFLGGPAPEKGKLLGSTVAARRFAGSPPNWLLGMAKPEDEAKKLMDGLRRDGVPFDENAGYRLVRYDGPNPLPQGKPNDVLVKVDPSYNPVWVNEDEIESKHRFHYKTAK